VYDTNFWESKQISAVVMPWIPFFSNCDGYDSRIVAYDAFEYHPDCQLPRYEDIRIVNPIPSSGIDPVSDSCHLEIKCRYDEPLNQTNSKSTRWYAILEETVLFQVTRDPIENELFHRKLG